IGETEVNGQDSQRNDTFNLDWNTSVLQDGRYDLRAVATDEFDPTAIFVSRPRRDEIVDGTPPTASVTLPAAPLHGVVTLGAVAEDANGIAAVRFERAAAGSGSWTAIGTRTRAPYSLDFDTRSVADGAYDFRVVATDTAGNSAPSPAAQDVAISNPGSVPP